MGRCSLCWKKVVNGTGDVADGCCVNNFEYRSGYTCSRKLNGEKSNKIYDIVCAICNTTLLKPLFQCKVMDGDIELHNINATNPTTAAKKSFSSNQY